MALLWTKQVHPQNRHIDFIKEGLKDKPYIITSNNCMLGVSQNSTHRVDAIKPDSSVGESNTTTVT